VLSKGTVCVASDDACLYWPTCEPQDALVTGVCALYFGVYWDGATCAPRSGCACAGADCGLGYGSIEACEAEHLSCLRPCGGHTPDGILRCSDDEYCDQTGHCGYADGGGYCRARPTTCPDEEIVFAPVCGCDGITYDSECHAHAAGAAVFVDVACEEYYDGAEGGRGRRPADRG
jgi:hypothetical protein